MPKEETLPQIEESAYDAFDRNAEKAYRIKSIDGDIKSLDETSSRYSTISTHCSISSQISKKDSQNLPQALKIKSLNKETNRDKSEY